jgi:hypothetical protein
VRWLADECIAAGVVAKLRSAGALQWLRLEHVIDRYGPGLYGRYTVIEAGRFRSRRLPSSAP